MTGDEKWIILKGENIMWIQDNSLHQRNIHSSKVMLCIWWDMKGVLYYELLHPNETVLLLQLACWFPTFVKVSRFISR